MPIFDLVRGCCTANRLERADRPEIPGDVHLSPGQRQRTAGLWPERTPEPIKTNRQPSMSYRMEKLCLRIKQPTIERSKCLSPKRVSGYGIQSVRIKKMMLADPDDGKRDALMQ